MVCYGSDAPEVMVLLSLALCGYEARCGALGVSWAVAMGMTAGRERAKIARPMQAFGFGHDWHT